VQKEKAGLGNEKKEKPIPGYYSSKEVKDRGGKAEASSTETREEINPAAKGDG